jgi:hypothetical protein
MKRYALALPGAELLGHESTDEVIIVLKHRLAIAYDPSDRQLDRYAGRLQQQRNERHVDGCGRPSAIVAGMRS